MLLDSTTYFHPSRRAGAMFAVAGRFRRLDLGCNCGLGQPPGRSRTTPTFGPLHAHRARATCPYIRNDPTSPSRADTEVRTLHPDTRPPRHRAGAQPCPYDRTATLRCPAGGHRGPHPTTACHQPHPLEVSGHHTHSVGTEGQSGEVKESGQSRQSPVKGRGSGGLASSPGERSGWR